MSMINFQKQQLIKKTILDNELNRNEAIIDEFVNIKSELKNARTIVVTNLMFDYLTLREEFKSLEVICNSFNEDAKYVEWFSRVLCDAKLFDDYKKEEICKMSEKDKNSNISMKNKRLILFKVWEQYPSIYNYLETRANRTADYMLGGLK